MRRTYISYVFFFLFVIDCAAAFGADCYLGPGCLDTTFGAAGRAIVMVTDPNDMVLWETSTDVKSIGVTNDGVVFRVNSDGSLDESFGTGGSSLPWPGAQFRSVAIYPDGRVLAAGFVTIAQTVRNKTQNVQEFAVVRLLADGGLDTSFGTGGITMIQFAATSSVYAESTAFQSDGKILVAGKAGTSSFGAARLNPNGTMDTGFASGGILSNTSMASVRKVALQTVDGEERIVLGGVAGYDFGVMRLRLSGALDSSFGSNGLATTDFFGQPDGIYDLLVSGDKIVATGHAAYPPARKSLPLIRYIGLARYNLNGSLDATFGTGGKVSTGSATFDLTAQAVAAQADGKILVAGYKSTGSTAYDFMLVRYNADGTLDTPFGADGTGLVFTDLGGNDYGQAVGIDSNGRIWVSGGLLPSGFTGLARYLPN